MFSWLRSRKDTVPHEKKIPNLENFVNPTAVLTKFTAITGIHFNQKESITTTKLIHFCRNHHISTFEELYVCLEHDPEILEALINLLTVNETYFFRESRQIYYLTEKVVASRENIRILCAPGSTGEEPYSIAIALMSAGVPSNRIEIISIDINSDVITLAKEGHYSLRSLHKTPQPLQEKYFIKEGDTFKICDEIKRLVTFDTINIFDDKLFDLGKFDTIFSRNMLIYFDEATVLRAVERLGRLARSKESLFFFGHADFVKTPPTLVEHYEQGVKFYKIS
ncbi:MAG: protein-glutamate O-methyltransferase CheR [Sulfuricurvum sp.]|uniref:CheR family methyltransferase n=1 Tax=Sulfuricurvum sp. TaxID=2025608 RepID=UPI0025ECCD22|nr:CheR family methyltransferase [Sulfuricurvum sp.]MBV5321753.1 protein-glutamate O-methyltransferase CheR [Sulfuricurvum sp.]